MNFDGNDLGPLNDCLKDALCDQIAKTIALDVGDKYSGYNCARRSNILKVDSHRKGPVPIEECILTKSTQAATYGTLDSECEELDFEELRLKNSNSTEYNKIRLTTNDKGDSIASCRALIMYFSKLAKAKDEEEIIDLHFVENLFDSGADINFPDKHGQTILHEIARGWHPDVVKFALENGAEINKADLYGRTPLHLAAAVDYGEMVEYLVENGAELGRETYEEKQTAMHYAAKNNAAQSLKIMLRLGARINDRDYKRRTPLFVAAEAARAESAQFLIEQGAPCGVYDISGTPLLSLLVEKMPQIAMEAVGQFHLLDRAFRKHYYYLSYLEPDPSFLVEKIPESKRDQKDMKAKKKAERKLVKEQGLSLPRKKVKTYAKTPLEVIVQYNQLDLIMHPVFQRLLYVKWHNFGKNGSVKLLALNLFYTLIWTILGILIPREGENFYNPIKQNWWRIILELMGVILTVYFLISEINLLKSGESSHGAWRQWRSQNLEKDLKFCHPRWPEEEKYLRSELAQIRSYQRTYFREPWNIFEWVTYLVVLTLVFTRILAVGTNNTVANNIHPRLYAIGLIIIWLRFMRSCRSFRMLGPFIAILGSVIADTLKFAFLFFEFFIPYTVAFWILFGGKENGMIMDREDGNETSGNSVDWMNFNDLTYSMWWMTLIGDFNWEGLVKVDRLMSQVLCGTYFALCGVVCMNLYIALLSDTFSRVYLQAQANAVMQQAKTIIILESKLDKFHRSLYGHYMQEHCSPQEVYTRDDEGNDEGNDEGKLDKMIRQITNRIDELDDTWKRTPQNMDFRMSTSRDFQIPSRRHTLITSSLTPSGDGENLEFFIRDQKVHNELVKEEIEELNNMLADIKSLISMNIPASTNSLYPGIHSNENLKGVNQHPSVGMSSFYPNTSQGALNDAPYGRQPSFMSGMQRTNMKQPIETNRKESFQEYQQQQQQQQQLQQKQQQQQQQKQQQQQQQQEQQQQQQLLQQGIQEMRYLQTRLENLNDNSVDDHSGGMLSPDTQYPSDRNDLPTSSLLYPQLSDSSLQNSGTTTPNKRRRRRRKSSKESPNVTNMPVNNILPLGEQTQAATSDVRLSNTSV